MPLWFIDFSNGSIFSVIITNQIFLIWQAQRLYSKHFLEVAFHIALIKIFYKGIQMSPFGSNRKFPCVMGQEVYWEIAVQKLSSVDFSWVLEITIWLGLKKCLLSQMELSLQESAKQIYSYIQSFAWVPYTELNPQLEDHEQEWNFYLPQN